MSKKTKKQLKRMNKALILINNSLEARIVTLENKVKNLEKARKVTAERLRENDRNSERIELLENEVRHLRKTVKRLKASTEDASEKTSKKSKRDIDVDVEENDKEKKISNTSADILRILSGAKI